MIILIIFAKLILNLHRYSTEFLKKLLILIVIYNLQKYMLLITNVYSKEFYLLIQIVIFTDIIYYC